MKILFLNYEYPPLGGGAANATRHLLREYAAMEDVRVDLITSAVDGGYGIEKIGERITIHKMPIGDKRGNLNFQSYADLLLYSFRAWRYAISLLKKERYDLIHAFFTVPCGFLAFVLGKRFKVPYIVSLRGADVPGYSQRFLWLYGILTPLIVRIWKKARFVVANSRGLQTLANRSDPTQPIEIIFNGVDTAHFVPGTRTAEDREKTFHILCASRLSRRKGFRYAIGAFALLHEKYPHIRMTIAGGEGNALHELRKQVAHAGLMKKIIFTGPYTHDTAPKIYQNADIFVFPSLNEGMSNNLLEAMASGLPILMTPTGGAEELVRDGENGFLVRMKDADDLAQKLKEIIADPSLAQRMGEESRRIAQSLDWRSAAQRYHDLYEKTIVS